MTDRERDTLELLGNISRRIHAKEHMSRLTLDVNSLTLKKTVDGYDRMKRDARSARVMRRWLFVVVAGNAVMLAVNVAGWLA